MSRQQYDPNSSPSPTPKSSTSRDRSPLQVDPTAARRVAATTSEEPTPSSRSPPVVPSSSSEGYPSWLPKRPPPPAPRSTIHSVGMFEPGPSASAGGSEPFLGGRKPTPRSVRVVSMQNQPQAEKDLFGRREATDPSRFSGPAHARVWSRATSAGLTPTVFSPSPFQAHVPRPRFRSKSFRPELLRHPSWKVQLWYFLFALFVFAHLPLQTFFDFNAVFVLLLVAKFPNPAAPGVPGSGRNWALGAAAYIACWFTQIFVVFLVYELIYSFIRRWRVKRPVILPIYLSAPAFNFVSLSSYTNFCFMYFIRLSAFTAFGSSPPPDSRGHGYDHHGNIWDGLAETFYFYSQNLPTVALLMPRAALSLALLLAFSSVDPSLPVGDAGIFSRRDGTFFRTDGTLTDYARGVLIANAAWTAWRILVLLGSWIGLWVVSGQGFAGLCGPRYRWEEEDVEAEKATAPFTFKDNASDHMDTPLPWSWREHTVLRVFEAWEFCLTNKYPGRGGSGVGKKEGERTQGFEGMEKVFAAIGLAGVPHPAKRGVLSDDLFEGPAAHEKAEEDEEMGNMDTLVPPPAVLASREKKGTVPAGTSGPITTLPYPFTIPSSAQVSSASSSQEVVPFPASRGLEVPITDEGGDHEEEEEHDDGEEHDDDDGDEEEEEEEEEVEVGESEEPSSERRTSGSMSSLGRPVTSRYPFQFRRPARGGSVSSVSAMPPPTVSTPHSQNTHSSNPSRSTQSRSTRHSRSTQSTGNPESSDSPMSNGGSSILSSPVASSHSGGIPMPPRHPQVQRRSRAGTVPVTASSPPPSSHSPVVFPAGRPRARTRTESVGTDTSMTFGPIPIPVFDDSDDDDDHHYHGHDESLMDVPEAEGSLEEAEQHDSVGLLSAGTSPRASLVNLRHLGSGLSLHHHHHHRRSTGSRSRSATSRSNSRSRTNSATSRSESARSRAQSLIHSLGAASRSSVDLVRSRANSMARLSDSPYYSTSPDPQPSSPENHTFGHPLREQWRSSERVDSPGPEGMREDEEGVAEGDSGLLAATQIPLPPSSPNSSSDSHTDFKSIVSQQPGQSSRHAPSEVSRAPPSEHASERSRRTRQGGTAPIPISRSAQLGVPQYTDSRPDISTADQSYVTAPATIEGKTDTSGQPSSWGTIEQFPQVPGGTWQPA